MASSTRARPHARASAEPARRQTKKRSSRAPARKQEGAVLITGICGRLGGLLTRRLHRVGPVVGVDRRRFDDRPADVKHHVIDLGRRGVREIFRAGGIRAVVHLGVMHNPRATARAHHAWNVVGFQKLLGHVAEFRVPKLVLLSSATLYGPSPDNPQFLREEAPLLGAQEFPEVRDLVEVDMLAQSFFWKHPEIETVILRPCHILGRVRNAASNYLRLPRPFTVMGFDPTMQAIHERDVVDAIVRALEPGARGIYNLRGPGELPLSRMLQMLGHRPRSVPGPLLGGTLHRMWAARATGFRAAELDHLRYVCLVDDTRARTELDFRPKHNMQQTLQGVYSQW